MSCNGCRVLRRGCSETCELRACLEGIENPKAQANATLFVSKFFGRSDLLSFISVVPVNKRSALFQSLLFEACGRTINPVNGAVGLLATGNWHVCQVAVDTVLAGGTLRPLSPGIFNPNPVEETLETSRTNTWKLNNTFKSPSSFIHVPDHHVIPSQPSDVKIPPWEWMNGMASFGGESYGSDGVKEKLSGGGGGEEEEGPKLLNLFG